MDRRGIGAVLAVAVLALGATGCSGDGEGAGAAPAPAPAVTAAPVAAAPGAPVPLAALADRPVAQRWRYLDVPVGAVVPAPDREGEVAALAARRADAAAPRTAGADDRFVRVGEATPSRWTELVVDVGRRRTLNPLRLARAAALVAVAAHEAAVTAAGAALPPGPGPREVDPSLGAPVPAVDSVGVELPAGQLPPELVASAAQRQVACAQFPVECPRFEALHAVAVRRAVATGALWPSTLDAALAAGAAVGDAVLVRAAGDGAAPWTPRPGDATTGPGGWVPTPGGYGPPLEPTAGAWRPWNLTRGDELRPPPPPAPGSPEHLAADDQVLAEATNLGDRELRLVSYWDLGPGTSTPPGYWLADITADAVRSAPVADQAAALALVATALLDAGIAVWDAKYAYWSARPVTVLRAGPSPQWLPSLVTPPFPGYVSGHAGFTTAAAEVMAVLFPARAAELRDAAAEATDSRLLGGIHYWFDLVAGVGLGERVGAAALGRAGLAPVAEGAPVLERLRYSSSSARRGGAR